VKFLQEQFVPRRAGDVVFRHGRIGPTVAFAVFAVAALAAAAAPLLGFDLPRPVAYGSSLGLTLFAWVASGVARAAWGPSNWLLRATPDGLYLKFRSYLNHGMPASDETVVFLARHQIVTLSALTRATTRPDPETTGGEQRRRRKFLRIRLDGGDLAGLAGHLSRERKRWAGSGNFRHRSNHQLVRTIGSGIVEVEWAGMGSVERALGLLAPRYPIGAPERIDDRALAGAPRSDLETQVQELAARGETMAAIKLAKRLYGIGTTEAKALVEKLRR
jgi:hypothetical protein